MSVERNLNWRGLYNARDLGGLRAGGGRQTRWGAVVRSEAPHRLSRSGWSALWDHGVRTIIDLREKDDDSDVAGRPSGLVHIRLPLHDRSDKAFWEHWRQLDCTPLYYPAFLERFPRRVALVVEAVAQAEVGGVLIHCGSGRDRTGIVTLVLLALAGVSHEDIAADYMVSGQRLRPLFEQLGYRNQHRLINERIVAEGTTAKDSVLDTLASFDSHAYLRGAGIPDDDLKVIRERLLA